MKLYRYNSLDGEQVRCDHSTVEAILNFGITFNLNTGEGLDLVSEVPEDEVELYKDTPAYTALQIHKLIAEEMDMVNLRDVVKIAVALNEGDAIHACALLDFTDAKDDLPEDIINRISEFYQKESEDFAKLVLGVE